MELDNSLHRESPEQNGDKIQINLQANCGKRIRLAEKAEENLGSNTKHPSLETPILPPHQTQPPIAPKKFNWTSSKAIYSRDHLDPFVLIANGSSGDISGKGIMKFSSIIRKLNIHIKDLQVVGRSFILHKKQEHFVS